MHALVCFLSHKFFTIFLGGVRRSPLTKVARSVSIKDVVAALEREPQMSKSSLLFRLYGRPLTEPSAK
jgi:transcription initiation factor TFIID subunit 4